MSRIRFLLVALALAVGLAACSEDPRSKAPTPVHEVPGVDEVQAKPTSPDEAQSRYAKLKAGSPDVDGMYVNGDGRYVALIKNMDAADAVRQLGFVPQLCVFCETALNALSDDIARQWSGGAEFSSSGVDLSVDRVIATLTRESPLAETLRSQPGVNVVIDPNRPTVAR